jgi:hypothetical protein
MASQASVYQKALRLLGEPSNVTVDSDKKIVREMTGAYSDVVRAVFESHPWNQFKTLVQLTQTTPGEMGWDYTFNIPATLRRIVLVNNTTQEDDLEGIEYAYRKGLILTNSETTYLWYVDSTFESQLGGWPQAFANYVSSLLADEVWPVNDESDNTRSRINSAIGEWGRKAKGLDASTDPVVRHPAGNYVRSRTAGLIGRGRYRGY